MTGTLETTISDGDYDFYIRVHWCQDHGKRPYFESESIQLLGATDSAMAEDIATAIFNWQQEEIIQRIETSIAQTGS